MLKPLRIGLIGLDTSHVPTFTKLLNDDSQQYHVPGGKVVAAFPGGSPDFARSWDRVEGYTAELRDNFGVEMLDSPAAVAESCDAILLTSVDGRVHLEQFRQIAPSGKPVFIDKPFATSSADARAMLDLARQHGVRLLSASSLRYAQALVDALETGEALIGADCSGPMNIEPTQGGLFWYGIHSVEMLYAALGAGCTEVWAVSTEDHELVTGTWKDGRIGTVRGNRAGNGGFGALLHSAAQTRYVNATAHPRPIYAGLLENIMTLFQTGESPVAADETFEVIRFIEAANESRSTGKKVTL